jgi:MYXO-CTERM domain-containing protein
MTSFRVAIPILFSFFCSSTSLAHVFLEAPEDGDVFETNSDVTIRWTISVNHGPPNVYDILFSPDGGDSVRFLIEGAPGSQGTLEWTTPSRPIEDGVVVVVQHGADGYTFMHDVHIRIVEPEPIEEPTPDLGVADAQPDVGVPDAGSGDAGPPDGGTPDAGTPDAVVVDRGSDHPEMMPMPEGTHAIDEMDPNIPLSGEDVLKLLERTCGMLGCHSGSSPQANLDLTIASFPGNIVGARSLTRPGELLISPCQPPQSEIIARIRGQRLLIMPPRPEPPLSEATIHQIEHWIEDGAPAEGRINGHGGMACMVEHGMMDPIGVEEGCSTTPVQGTPRSALWALLIAGLLLLRRRYSRP